MGYKVSFEEANKILAELQNEYEIWAPKRFVGKGRYSDTDLVKYAKINTIEEVEYKKKSDFPAKEVLTPITESLFYFTEDEFIESKATNKKLLIFMRPCDIHAQHHQERIYLSNGNFEDMYYKRMNEKVKIVMMECAESWDTCFCVSMGTNKAEDYSLAVRFGEDGLLVDVKDQDFAGCFENDEKADFTPDYVKENVLKVTVPDKFTGDVMGDLNRRRGRVLGMNSNHHGKQIIEADIPMSELFGYNTDLRSMTGGIGEFSYEFSRYEQAPGDVQKREVEARAAEAE